MIALTMTATVYTRHGTTGLFSEIHQSGLKCRLFHVSRQPSEFGLERAALDAERNLHYDPSYTAPTDPHQFAIDDGTGEKRWNPVLGTDGVIAPFGPVIQKRITVLRAS